MSNLDMNDIGEQLRVLRVLAGLSQDALAAKAGTTRQTISRIENRRLSPTLYVLSALTAALGCQVAIVPRGRPEVTA